MSMNSKSLLGSISKASPLATPLEMMYGLLEDKKDANEKYNALISILHDALSRGCRFESKEIQSIVKILRDMPPAGARRNNFEKLYLKDEYTLRKLPKDARDIPYGHWY